MIKEYKYIYTINAGRCVVNVFYLVFAIFSFPAPPPFILMPTPSFFFFHKEPFLKPPSGSKYLAKCIPLKLSNTYIELLMI